MSIDWNKADKDYLITYMLYLEGKDINLISKIRNISSESVKIDIIKSKQHIKLKDMQKIKEDDEIKKILVMDKNERLKYIQSLNGKYLESFKKKLYEKMVSEDNAQDLMVLIWTCGELNDIRFLNALHVFSKHRHGGVRRMSFSAMGKMQRSESIEYLHKGLLDKKPQVRQYSARALMKIGDITSVKKLKNLVENPNEKEYVKKSFIDAINEIQMKISKD